MRRGLVGAMIAGMALLAPASAAGDGLPVLNIDAGPAGVTAPQSSARFVTIAAGRDTVVARVRVEGGQVERSRVLKGQYTVPAVALDATASGLSANGRTLVLISPRLTFPRDETTFKVLDPRTLETRQTLTLDGDFSFDALSPDGRTLYLVNYISRRDPTRYAVRAYDLRERRLLPDPIVDATEPAEEMRGFAITRATSQDGRWEYTLYDGAGSHPFIHALDTVEASAACIDLDALAGHKRLYQLRLDLGPSLRVVDRGTPVAVVDLETFRVSDPATAASPAAKASPQPQAPAPAEDDDTASIAAAVATALLIAGAALLVLRRRARPEPADLPELEAEREEPLARR